jgi:hypothetical protein
MNTENRPKRRQTTYRFHLTVGVVQKDPRPLTILQNMFGGKVKPIYRRKRTQRYNQWLVSSNRAYAALFLLEPFLRIKKEQAQCGIELQKSINSTRTTFNQWNKLSAEVTFYRRQLYGRCRFLNSKEYISSLNTASGELGEHLSETTPSEAAGGEVVSAERVTDRSVTPKNNPTHERPTPNAGDDIS